MKSHRGQVSPQKIRMHTKFCMPLSCTTEESYQFNKTILIQLQHKFAFYMMFSELKTEENSIPTS